jgi:hypothetical protein
MNEAGTEYTAWLASSLQTYVKLARSLVEHNAEKGRIIETVVKSALRAILPARFSIGTGFAITASGKSSSQLDIVIYDGFFNTPMMLEGGIGLFPIECIYGFMEVKTQLSQKDTIEETTQAIAAVHEFKEKLYAVYGEHEVNPGEKVVGEYDLPDPLSPRSFVFAFNSAYANIGNLEAHLKECTEKDGAHVHALAVLEKDWFIHQKPYRRPHEFIRSMEGQAFADFCVTVLQTIQSFPVRPASMSRYLRLGQ